MDLGREAAIWLARAATTLYVLALALMWRRRSVHARALWTGALGVYLLHVVCAFTFFYDWSHAIAHRETARQTAELFGVNWGGGIFVNYAFTAIWSADCLWWWAGPESYGRRPAVVSASVHGFLAFIFLNATVVVWILS